MKISFDEVTPELVIKMFDDISIEQPDLWDEWLVLEKENAPIGAKIQGALAQFIQSRVAEKNLHELSNLMMKLRREMVRHIQQGLV